MNATDQQNQQNQQTPTGDAASILATLMVFGMPRHSHMLDIFGIFNEPLPPEEVVPDNLDPKCKVNSPYFISQIFRHKGVERGLFVAYRWNGRVYVGWSMCKPGDDLDRHVGRYFAIQRVQEQIDFQRALKNNVVQRGHLPPSMVEAMQQFQKRCKKYYDGIPFATEFLPGKHLQPLK